MIAFILPGGKPVYAFSLIITLGAAVGLAWVAWRAPEKVRLPHLDAVLWVLLGGLVGGRAAYVAVNWLYFQSHPLESLQVYLGGLSWPGALVGGLLALALYAWFTRQSLGVLADALAPLLVCLAVSAWLGCWLDGCAYGPPTHAWWGIPSRDEWGVLARRWPIQIMGALLVIGMFWVLDRFTPRGRAGALGGLALLGVSLLLFGFSWLRIDPAPLWRGLRLDTWAALGFALLALVGLAGVYFRRPLSAWMMGVSRTLIRHKASQGDLRSTE